MDNEVKMENETNIDNEADNANETGKNNAVKKDKIGSIELDVKMDMGTLSKFVLRSNFLRSSGIIGLILSVAALVLLIVFWGKFVWLQRLMLLALGLLFTVIQPIMLVLKESKTLKTGVYREKVHYSIYKDGIDITSIDGEVNIVWDDIYKLSCKKNAIYIYMNALLAFIINKKSCGSRYDEVVKYLKEHING